MTELPFDVQLALDAPGGALPRHPSAARLEQAMTAITHGAHPLLGRDLHSRADLDPAPCDDPSAPYRCGSCAHLVVGRWPKCELAPGSTHPSTDVESWWPACFLWQPRRTP